MALEVHVLTLPAELPSLEWHWEAETDILGGTFAVPSSGRAYTATGSASTRAGSSNRSCGVCGPSHASGTR